MSLWQNRFWGPMLLTEQPKAFDDKSYLFEIKFDGIRTIIFATNQKVEIRTRNNKDITNLFPELQAIKNLVKGRVIFDGEVVAMENNLPSLSKLQERIHLHNEKKIKYLSETNPVIFVAFDILYENKDLINKPLIDRKNILEQYEDTDIFIKSKIIYHRGIELFKVINKMKMEGIVAKKIDSKYQVSSRSADWIKIKNFKTGKFYIGGYIEKDTNAVCSLLLGEYKNNKLYYVGKVSIGKKRKLYEKVKMVKVVKKSPFYDFNKDNITYLVPKIGINVQYLERTNSNHLRQPFIP